MVYFYKLYLVGLDIKLNVRESPLDREKTKKKTDSGDDPNSVVWFKSLQVFEPYHAT